MYICVYVLYMLFVLRIVIMLYMYYIYVFYICIIYITYTIYAIFVIFIHYRPMGGESEIMLDFEGKHGDRRQELVFIGQYNDSTPNNPKSKKALENVLDSCLLTDEEMKVYERVSVKGEDALRDLYFPNNPQNNKNKK